jgi:hypothetical protein
VAVKSRMIRVMRIWDYECLSNRGHEQISDYEITKRSEAYMAQFEETTCKSDIFLYHFYKHCLTIAKKKIYRQTP